MGHYNLLPSSNNTMKLSPLLPIILYYSLPGVSAITCYSCTQDKVVNSSCTEHDKAEYCKDMSWCVKTWRDTAGISWGCINKGPSDEYEGCTSETRDAGIEETTCYCNTDLCNSSTVPTLTFYIVLLCLLFSLL